MKMTFRVILVGGLIVFFAVVTVVVFTPAAIWRPPQTSNAEVRTAEQERGRVLFYSNGCNYCHTQYVRAVDNGMGPVSNGGDYVFDNPMTLGSERTGPDLSHVGRKRSLQWEIDHLRSPREFSPLSIMPRFSFLPENDLRAIAEYLFFLGDRAAAERMVSVPEPYQAKRPSAMSTAIPASGANPPAQGWPTFKESGLYEGKKIYVSRCMTCHGCAGNGLGHYGGTLIVTPANFKADPFRNMTDPEWFWHVSEGVQGTVMPPWRESLSVDQRWRVIRYIQAVYARTFERDPDEGDVPRLYAKKNPLPLTVENLEAGKSIWTRECLVCHGDAATGEGPYRQGIEPVPPDFSDLAGYKDFTDGDYLWRISEGVPWTAMPTWKVQYTETERWQLVHYVRSMFTQSQGQPAALPANRDFDFPTIMRSMRLPASADFNVGRQQFLELCAHCHGLAGDGKGWAGAYLDPKPFDLHNLSAASQAGSLGPNPDGGLLARITFGIKVSAMPKWGEFLTERERWDDVRFLEKSFIEGAAKAGASVMGDGSVPADYVRTDPGIYESEIATIVPAAGKAVYQKYCETCHGVKGAGDGPGIKTLASGGPAPFPQNMSNPYIFYRVREGADDTMMYGFSKTLSEQEVWDVTAYIVQLTGGKWGG